MELALPYHEPFDAPSLLAFLGQRAVPGVEHYQDGVYRRSLALPGGPAVVELTPGQGEVRCRVWLEGGAERDVGEAVSRCRALLDLDADPRAVALVLMGDPGLAPLVERWPGLRVPGHVDGAELAVRAVLGQQVTVAGATTMAARLVAQYGEPLATSRGGVTHLFPAPAVLASAGLECLPMPGARKGALRALMGAVAAGDLVLQPGAGRVDTTRRLLALPGIGPWTASYIAMRALGDRDAFLAADVGVRRAAGRLGWDTDPRSLERRSERWRPWRAYATLYLWASLQGAADAAGSPDGI